MQDPEEPLLANEPRGKSPLRCRPCAPLDPNQLDGLTDARFIHRGGKSHAL